MFLLEKNCVANYAVIEVHMNCVVILTEENQVNVLEYFGQICLPLFAREYGEDEVLFGKARDRLSICHGVEEEGLDFFFVHVFNTPKSFTIGTIFFLPNGNLLLLSRTIW